MGQGTIIGFIDSEEQSGAWARNAIEEQLKRPTRELNGAILIIPCDRTIVHGNSRVTSVGILAHAQYVLSKLEEG